MPTAEELLSRTSRTVPGFITPYGGLTISNEHLCEGVRLRKELTRKSKRIKRNDAKILNCSSSL